MLVPASEQPILAIKLTEAMTRALPDRAGHHVAHGADAVIEAIGRGGALVLGPGIGRDEETLEFAREVAARAEVALVLDADGLNAHAGALESLAGRSAPTVLTPHAGELGRLLDDRQRCGRRVAPGARPRGGAARAGDRRAQGRRHDRRRARRAPSR